MFEDTPAYPGDPILTLNETFKSDPRSHKVNLGIGVYLDAHGRLPVMAAVRAAVAAMPAAAPSPYLPMEGAPLYRRAMRDLLFGAGSAAVPDEHIATVQTVGGSGALRLGAEFLAGGAGARRLWISDPSWDNHRAIFSAAGFIVNSYPYYNGATRSVDFEAMRATLDTLARGSIVLLHACGHNPTGVDLNEAQWRTLSALFRTRGLLAFFDIAYQGFGAGLEEDAFALRQFASDGNHFLVANSLSKNFALYGERCGALSVVCGHADVAARVLGQLSAAVRRNYSSPPAHGSVLATAVLGDPVLRALWEAELSGMRERIRTMRSQLHAALRQRGSGAAVDYLLTQQGMFSYTGATVDQVDRLREQYGVYLVGSGRLCLAALTEPTVAPVADALASVLG